MNKMNISSSAHPPASRLLDAVEAAGKVYDPELLYVECKLCGRPILWEQGRTTSLLLQSNINPLSIDAHCLILSEGCRECMPDADGFHLSIIRLATMPMSAVLLLQKPAGNA